MSVISISTPEGLKKVRISGDTPTPEELGKIQEAYPDSSGQGFSYDITGQSETVEQETLPEPVGEAQSGKLRFQLGRMDNDEEKQNLLNQLLGEGTTERVSQDTFVIDQSKVSPEIRENYGFSDTGRIYLDEPGFTFNDLIDFGGEAGPEVAMAIGASLASTGVGIIPGMLIVGAAAGATKAADELIEYSQGLNRQSAGEVAGMIATSAVSNALFEGGGRLVAKVIGRLIKGPGAEISAARLKELEESGKFKSSSFEPGVTAKQAAREEASADFSRLISEGAKPTIQAATGKSLAARTLAVNEKIAPNPNVGRANFGFVQDTLKKLDEGILSEDQALKMLADNNSSIARDISSKLADPEQAFKLSQRHLDDIVKKELAEYEAKFVPSEKLPSLFTDNLQLAATLFKTEASNLYDVAEKTIGGKGIFDIKPIVDTIDNLAKDNPFVQYSGALLDTIKKRASEGGMGIGELQQLRSALRSARGDTDLVSSAAQGGIGRVINSVDELMDSKQIELAKASVDGFEILRHPAGAVDSAGNKIGGRTYKVDIGPTELASLRKGLDEWSKSNAFFREGQEAFNNTAVNTILKAAKDKFFTSNIDVVNTVVQSGNAPKLAMYLNAVTPTKEMTQKLASPGANNLINNVKQLVEADNFVGAEELVKGSGLEGIIPKIRGFIDDLPAEDVFRVSQKKSYLKELDNLSQLAESGIDPQLMRESVKNSLAKTWIDQTKGSATDSLNKFNSSEFASKFTSLGDDLQNTLFGKPNAQSMREAMEAFQVNSLDENAAAQLFQALPTLTNQSLKAQISTLKEITERATLESKDAVLSSIKSGNIETPSKLVSGLLTNPNSYNKLKTVVGIDELEKAGGVKDMVMNNLIRGSLAKPGFSEVTIQGGEWGKALKDVILKQNKNGALSTILGDDVVSNLNKLSDDAIKVSDIPIKGYGGIAAAPAALALVALAVKGSLLTAGAGLATIIGLSRAMRNNSVLKLLTSPRLRKKEYEEAIKLGANLPDLNSVKSQGQYIYNLNRLGSIFTSEASLVAGSGILGEIGGEGRKAAEQRNIEFSQKAQESLPDPERVFTRTPMINPSLFDPTRKNPQGGVPSLLNQQNSQEMLRNEEIRKLMGMQ
tara:strand:+ start:1637 stop:4999 length:3363 start_codon:yes stop_codon:yes gene_type:complete